MSRIEWNQPGERFFETGIDRGVFFPVLGPGVPWNGLVSVNENSSGGDLESLYFDGVKYLDIISGEDFAADLTAFAAPAQFGLSDGQKALSPGLVVTQQPRRPFGLSYRTLIGNDLVGSEYGYKLHIVYNCMAAPSGQSNVTVSENVTPGTKTWALSTVPPRASTFRPSAHLVVNSTLSDPSAMSDLEDVLYGEASVEPRLPTVAEIVSILA